MPRNNPTRATLKNKVRARPNPNKALFVRKLKKLLNRAKPGKSLRFRSPRPEKTAR